MRAFLVFLMLWASPALGFEPKQSSQLVQRAIALTDPVAAPTGMLTDANGRALYLKSFEGEVSVVTLWATWCHECHTEMPRLAALAKLREGTKIKVRPVSIDDPNMSTTLIRRHMKKEGITALPLIRDTKRDVWNKIGARGTPTTLIIDRFGQVVSAVVGGRFEWTDPEVLAYLDALAVAPNAAASRLVLTGGRS